MKVFCKNCGKELILRKSMAFGTAKYQHKETANHTDEAIPGTFEFTEEDFKNPSNKKAFINLLTNEENYEEGDYSLTIKIRNNKIILILK
ncbi:MAG: hypothetical protein QXL51_06955 [Candidatus Aenigmatarchaeota archaeon]